MPCSRSIRHPPPPHYLVPLPANLRDSSPELFGFFVYEVRIGHNAKRWCTAQGRFGPMLRIAGVQHPAPPLICQAARTAAGILVRAPFATPVIDGANFRPSFPATQLWAVLYARVQQMDRQAFRNILIAQTPLHAFPVNELQSVDSRVFYGEGLFPIADLTAALNRLGLLPDTPLTVLGAELFNDVLQGTPVGPFGETQAADPDPLGTGLANTRTLRISPLTSVRDAC